MPMVLQLFFARTKNVGVAVVIKYDYETLNWGKVNTTAASSVEKGHERVPLHALLTPALYF